MDKLTSFAAICLLAIGTGYAQTDATISPAEPANAPAPDMTPAQPASISVKDMLVSGPTQLKLHALAMISQGNIPDEIDDSYLPGLKACARDEAIPLRSVAAQILGQSFIQGKDNPNPEAVILLIELARDEASYVSYNAVYYGISQIRNKSDEIINLLISTACKQREQTLSERIADALKPDLDRVTALLDQKLEEGNDIAIYEIYEDLTGRKPGNTEKYQDMPSSLPRLFIFKITGADSAAYESELRRALQAAGIENPNVVLSGKGENTVALLRTYITRDRLAVRENFTDHPDFKLIQAIWLTPELEIQMQARQNR